VIQNAKKTRNAKDKSVENMLPSCPDAGTSMREMKADTQRPTKMSITA